MCKEIGWFSVTEKKTQQIQLKRIAPCDNDRKMLTLCSSSFQSANDIAATRDRMEFLHEASIMK